jgi:hypothetical protein
MLNGLPMRFLSASFVVPAVMAVLLWSGAARAQTAGPTATITGVVTRVEADGSAATDAHKHPDGVLNNAVNFNDCEANLALQYTLSVTGIGTTSTNYNLETWAGTSDCSQLAARTPATATCWRVAAKVGPSSVQQTTTVTVRAQDVASQISSGATKNAGDFVASDEKACHAQTDSGSTNVTVYFFFASSADGSVSGTPATAPVTVDLLAGSVNGDISLEFGSTLLYVNLTASRDPDIKGYNVYCDPPKDPNADASVGDASTTTTTTTTNTCDASTTTTPTADASLDDGGDASAAVDSSTTTPTPASCDGGTTTTTTTTPTTGTVPAKCHATSALVSGGGTTTTDEAGVATTTGGVQRLIPGAFLCGQFDSTSTRLKIDGLTDGVLYDIAVAARDAVGNVGPLSNVDCETPGPIDDFWDAYNKAGGGAGASCALEGAGMPAGTGILALGMIGAAVAATRRRRRS